MKPHIITFYYKYHHLEYFNVQYLVPSVYIEFKESERREISPYFFILNKFYHNVSAIFTLSITHIELELGTMTSISKIRTRNYITTPSHHHFELELWPQFEVYEGITLALC